MSPEPSAGRTLTWSQRDAHRQLADLCELVKQPGLLLLRFSEAPGEGAPLTWRELEPWTRGRAVTVAEIAVPLESPALEVALCADLVLLREQVVLTLPPVTRPLPAGLLWALGRAGRAALARGLLDGGPITAEAALELGLAQGVVAAGAPLPLPEPLSIPALTLTRDLLRAHAADRGSRQLELASFRLLFTCPDPGEGAQAFLERRQPRFRSDQGSAQQ